MQRGMERFIFEERRGRSDAQEMECRDPRRLLAKCGGLLRVTSANLSGQRAATDAPAALADVGLSADIVVDDGISPGGVPSTVVKVDGGHIEVLRLGACRISDSE